MDDKSDLWTSLACFAMTATSLGSSLPVRAPITAPITGSIGLTWSAGQVWYFDCSHLRWNFKEFESSATSATTDRVALVDAGGAAASHGEEELETEVGDVPQREGVLAVQVDSLDSDEKMEIIRITTS